MFYCGKKKSRFPSSSFLLSPLFEVTVKHIPPIIVQAVTFRFLFPLFPQNSLPWFYWYLHECYHSRTEISVKRGRKKKNIPFCYFSLKPWLRMKRCWLKIDMTIIHHVYAEIGVRLAETKLCIKPGMVNGTIKEQPTRLILYSSNFSNNKLPIHQTTLPFSPYLSSINFLSGQRSYFYFFVEILPSRCKN